MEKLFTEEAKRKKAETLANNLPQISDPEERETHISIDYFSQKIFIYTNNATTINRMARKGYEHKKEEKIDGQVYSRSYEFDFKDMSKVATVSLFK